MNNEIPYEGFDRYRLEPRGMKRIYSVSYWHNGKHRRKSLKTTNLKVAQRRLREFAYKLEHGEYNEVSRKLTIMALHLQYLDYLRTENRSKKTIAKYTRVLRVFAEFLDSVGIVKAHQLQPTHFDSYRAAHRDDWSPYTLYNYSVVVKQAYKWAARRQLIHRNPLENYELNKRRRVQHACPNEQQIKQILEQLTAEDRLLVLVLAMTGMRSGELYSLLDGDVDLDGNWFTITSREDAETKSRENRKVPIHPVLLPLLKKYQKKGCYFFLATLPGQEPAAARHLQQKSLNDRFTRAVRRAGMTAGRAALGFVIHSLRHFFKSHVLNSGTPQPVADYWLGHRPEGMNATYYHLSDEESQRQMKKIPFSTF